jgi:sialic acid synthase SpsE
MRGVATALRAPRASAAELANRPLVRKALYARRDLAAGAALSGADLVPLRPLLDGIPALERDDVIGRRIVRDLPQGTRLRRTDIGDGP